MITVGIYICDKEFIRNNTKSSNIDFNKITIGMKILTTNFYKFLFGFIAVIFLSLTIISVAGFLDKDSNNAQVAGDCLGDTTDC